MELDVLEQILIGKEQEIRAVYTRLRSDFQHKVAECADLYSKYQQIQADHAYNIDIIAKRDIELNSLEKIVDGLKYATAEEYL